MTVDYSMFYNVVVDKELLLLESIGKSTYKNQTIEISLTYIKVHNLIRESSCKLRRRSSPKVPFCSHFTHQTFIAVVLNIKVCNI